MENKLDFGGAEVHMVGTVHVSKKSAQRVRKTVEEVGPSMVCIELDMQRYTALTKLREGGHFRYSPSISDMLSLPGLLRWIQNEIGKEFGVMPGLEMVTAASVAKENNIHLGLIDRKIDITLTRLWGAMPFKEKAKLMTFIAVTAGVFLLKPIIGNRAYGIASLFSDNTKTLDMGALEKGEGVSDLILLLKDQFPTIYRVLVEERNIYMSTNILSIISKGAKKIVVVVGAGHVEGMKETLERKNVKVIVH